MNVPGLRRTPVEWVDVYTRQTLLALLWLTVLFLLLGAMNTDSGGAAMTAIVAVTAGVLGAGTWAQRAVSDAWPDQQPTPTRPVLAMCAVAGAGVAVAATLPEDPRPTALLIVWVGVVYSLAGLRDRRHLAALLLVTTVGVLVATQSAGLTALSVAAALFIGATVHASLWLLEVVRRLDRARDTETALAVAEERLRFSRDVHDVLGRHLSTIAVRAELAAALARRGDDSAADLILEVRGSAHDALREIRELARGYRSSNLEQELDGARSLLAAAGIETTVDVDDLPVRWHEPAAWVVRETVTNVLRHSEATLVEVVWRDGVLSVSNDGARPTTTDGGVGIIGLTERLAPLGSVVSTTMRSGRWTLAATMPTEGQPATAVGRSRS